MNTAKYRNPTVKQEKAFHKVYVEGKSVKKAMEEVGYKVTKNPQELTRSDGWLAIMEKHGLTDDNLAKRHQELLKSRNENIAVKSLDIAYKVKGKYDNNSSSNTFNAPVQIVINPMTPKDMANTKGK